MSPLVLLWHWQGALLAVCGACALALVAQMVQAELDADVDPRRSISLAGVLRPLGQVFAHRDVRNLVLSLLAFGMAAAALVTALFEPNWPLLAVVLGPPVAGRVQADNPTKRH